MVARLRIERRPAVLHAAVRPLTPSGQKNAKLLKNKQISKDSQNFLIGIEPMLSRPREEIHKM